MPGSRPFSVIIPWCNRPEIEQTLAANAPLFARHAAEVLVVNYGGDPDRLQAAIDRQHVAVRHIVLADTPFNKCAAVNVGVHLSTGPFLFLLDTDITLESDIFQRAHPLLAGGRTLVTVRRVRETVPPPTSIPPSVKGIVNSRLIHFADGRKARLLTYDGADGSRGGPGLMLMAKAHFLQVGGFDSSIVGWGFDDIDLVVRLQRELNLTLKPVGTVLHHTHGDDVRVIRFGSRDQNSDHNRRQSFAKYACGQFTGSYETDVRAWQDRVYEREAAGLVRRHLA